MKEHLYFIDAGPQTRKVEFHNFTYKDTEPYIGAITIHDHTGYKMSFSKQELKNILKIISEIEKTKK